MTASIRPIVFLDLDDVLVLHGAQLEESEFTSKQVTQAFASGDLDKPALWANLVAAEPRENLAILAREFPCQFVISSSWASYLTRQQLCEVFNRTELKFVSNSMHRQWTSQNTRGPGAGRLSEITKWLHNYGVRDQAYLILDDLESGWNLLGSSYDRCGRVVLCKPGLGLNSLKLHEAQRKMRMLFE